MVKVKAKMILLPTIILQMMVPVTVLVMVKVILRPVTTRMLMETVQAVKQLSILVT